MKIRKNFLFLSLSVAGLLLLAGCSGGGTETATTSMTAVLNGDAVNIAYVYVDSWGEDDYTWTFSSVVPDSACSVPFDDDGISFSSKGLEVGTFTKTMEEEVDWLDYDAYYYYTDDSGDWTIGDAWDWAATVTVTKVDETTTDADSIWKAGTVTGTADFEFDDGSTLSGTFLADLCDYSF